MSQPSSGVTRYEPTWESLRCYSVPEWFGDAKFGIFIHWGVYSVPAFGNEWYPRNMYIQGSPEFEHHVKTYGPQSRFGYKDFIPRFKAAKFDPEAWVELFKKAGAKYIVPVAEHHDGFAMYACSLSDWNAVKMGPKRDIVGELAAAVRKQDLVFGLSSHRAEHWWFFNGGMTFESDVQDPQYDDLYGPAKPNTEEWHSRDWKPRPNAKFLDDWLARTCELVDKYQPQLVWFDWWIEQIVFEPYLQKFATYYYNRGLEWDRGVVINYKNQAFPDGTAVYDVERGQMASINPLLWQADTSISKGSWGYVKGQDYKTASDIVGNLVDIVSKNGTLLLNVGPCPDGTIPEPEQDILLEIGQWLEVNGEAIYGSRPWVIFGEGPTDIDDGSFTDTKRAVFTSRDIRFTLKEDTLYAVCLGWPENGEVNIQSLGVRSSISGRAISQINMLGSEGTLSWSQDKNGLKVKTPLERPCQHAYTLKIVLKG